MSNIVHEDSGGLLRDMAIAVLVFEHAVKLAVVLTHINSHGETQPTKESKADCRRKILQEFWKLADRELWPPPA